IPTNILAKNDEELRLLGLSRQKIAYLRNISLFFIENSEFDWINKSDAEVIKELVAIKGIGTWSAEMFLIFHLLRQDIFPVKDIGLQKAIEKHYNDNKKMALSEMSGLAENWQPYRSVATWYLWRSLDPIPVEY
ncbi:MAG: DNA-3-methyladenine glycosylase 2 family protein, partial [Pseudomonadota bacterium]